MWIRSVTAHCFGPLVGQTLGFAERMTVIVGDNESAKSTWHAAIYAALCGRKRGRGRARHDQEFIDAHKPWDRDDWLVSAEICLDDGREIELRQDLAGLVDCHAKELVLGRDVSSEIMNDQTPDGSKWLGLDRSSFASTACIQQGQMLRVRDAASSLQDHLQRAAATARADTTAVTAINRINEFATEHVGRNIANTNKPLRVAIVNNTDASNELAQRRRDHEDYLSRLRRLESLQQKAADAENRVQAQEAAAAASAARKQEERFRRARELYELVGGREPVSSVADSELAQRVSDALALWRLRPSAPTAPEQTSVQLQIEIDKLPAMPVGDLDAHSSVNEAMAQLHGAMSQLDLHIQAQPEATTTPSALTDGKTDIELLELATYLTGRPPSVSRDLVDREAAAHQTFEKTKRRVRISLGLIIAGLIGTIIGILLFARPQGNIGITTASAGVAICITGLVIRLFSSPSTALQSLVEARGLLDSDKKRVAIKKQQWTEAAVVCQQLGIPVSAEALREIPAARALATERERQRSVWIQQKQDLEQKIHEASSNLYEALNLRGCTSADLRSDTVISSANAYMSQCRSRAEQARAASERTTLTMKLEAAKRAEQRAQEDQRKRSEASDRVLTVAEECEVSCTSAEDAAKGLQTWAQQRSERQKELALTQQRWTELQMLLAGKPLSELERAATEAATNAERLGRQVNPNLLKDISKIPTSFEGKTELRQQALRARTEAAREEGELQLFAAELGSVAEAEERLAQTQVELDRVNQLKETLELTKKFLLNAQTRVFRDIAPVLRSTVKEWLPELTGDRYIDVMVEPATLQVQVCGPLRQWRKADLLSYGTAEQIYLLLRVALAEHLTQGKETCPLLLDDITVHADTPRTHKILDLLLKISSERQIIFFTQEEQVANWADSYLKGPGTKIHRLDQVRSV